jgi:hypothetical protein
MWPGPSGTARPRLRIGICRSYCPTVRRGVEKVKTELRREDI